MMQRLLGVGVVAVLLALSGCTGFFSDPNTTTTTGTGSTTGDYVYVVNEGSNSLSGFSLATGSLVNVSSSAYGLASGLAPTSAVVSRANSLVYVGGLGAIYCYSIGSGGALTAVTGGGTTTTGDVVSMATSPDGQWLLALSNSSTASGAVVTVYAINTTTGVLTAQSTPTIQFNSTIGAVVPHQIKISSNADYVAISLGTAGDELFAFTTSTGILTQTASQPPSTLKSTGAFLSDNCLAFNSSGTALFVGTTGAPSGGDYISSYPINSSGVLGTAQTITTGNAPASLETDSTGAYLYAANVNSGSITGYTVSSTGALTAMTNSPFAASAGVTALVRDQSGDFLLAVSNAGGTSTTSFDLTLYAFDKFTAGQLDAIGTAVSGTDPSGSVAIAATH